MTISIHNIEQKKLINNSFNDKTFIEKTKHLTISEMGHVTTLLFYIHLINCGDCENFTINFEALDSILNLDLKFLTTCDYAEIITKHINVSDNVNFYELHKTLLKYSFHGFSSAYLESVKQHGLDSSKKMSVNLYQKYLELNCKYLPIIQDLLITRDHDKVFFSESIVNTYSYACHSPEWFERFAPGFYKRDYEGAKQIMMEILDFNFKLAPPEFAKNKKTIMEELVSFFNECWNLFATSQPVMAVFEGYSQPMDYEDFKNFEQITRNTCKDLSSMLEKVIDKTLLSTNIDNSTDKIIPFEELQLFYLTDPQNLNHTHQYIL